MRHSANYSGNINDGWNLQHIYEGGEQFEKLLDHPAWYGRVAKYLGRASPFVFELFINVRNPVSNPILQCFPESCPDRCCSPRQTTGGKA